jgi:hypothetical protein
MPVYAAYGLGIDSEIELPELLESGSGDDIVIRRGRVDRVPGTDPDSDDYVRIDGDTLIFHTPYGGFRISSAREITVDASPHGNPTALRLAILGRALGALLQWRGLFALHASAVARDGRAIAFAGQSGAGKSTTAGAHLAGGWQLVADDIVAVDLSERPPRVRPAFPQLKLWPDAADALGIAVEGLDRVHDRLEKRFVPVDADRLVPGALPLDAVYILGEGNRQGIELLGPQEALVELLRHSYAPRIMRALGRQGDHLMQCAHLATSAPTLRMTIDRHRISDSAIVELVEESRSALQKTFGLRGGSR